MQLQDQIHGYRSPDVTAGAMMWLQEQNVAAGLKMWLQEKLFKHSFSRFVATSVIFGLTVFWSRFARHSFCWQPIFIFLNPAPVGPYLRRQTKGMTK